MNDKTLAGIEKVFEIFTTSEGEITPHFFLTGESGSGKSYEIQRQCENHDLLMIPVNAAQLTKEGTSGNSLSKALAPLSNRMGQLAVVFVDEFDKLFISGNSNSELAHETTNGVQNEFLTVLESGTAQVFGDYGKYNSVPTNKILFVFAGAFNGEADIDIDRMRDFGIKTEFLGRVGIHFGLEKLTLDQLRSIAANSKQLDTYCSLFKSVDRDAVINEVMDVVTEHYDRNALGARLINTLVHQYFIYGGLKKEPTTKKTVFTKTLNLPGA